FKSRRYPASILSRPESTPPNRNHRSPFRNNAQPLHASARVLDHACWIWIGCPVFFTSVSILYTIPTFRTTPVFSAKLRRRRGNRPVSSRGGRRPLHRKVSRVVFSSPF